ncbi:MAG: hypothetical protein COB85_01010 [Bacteroidetes bacterium]|nr:MAG: hypothetical protein COB85_01010 [Bacteroidota bacterium]
MKKLFTVILVLTMFFSSYAQDSLNITALYNWKDTITTVYNEVWGFVQNGREYAVIGSWQGAHFFDVTDPQNVVKVDYVPGTVTACDPVPCIHRDYHDYNGYLYMVTDEDTASTMQIVDLSSLPDSVTLVYESNTLFSKSHNIFIDSSSARLYSCGGDQVNNGLRVFSLADPINPVEIANLTTPGGYVHDVYVRNDTAYLHSGGNGFNVYDYTDLGNPILLGSLPSVGGVDPAYSHAGWLNAEGNTFVLCYETANIDVNIVDVSDLANMLVVDTVNSGGDTNSIPHNVIIRGDYAYVSYYHDGLYIYNISNPSATTLAGFYDTKAQPGPGGGAWGVYPLLPSGIVLISDMTTGFWVLDVTAAIPVNVPLLKAYNGHLQIYPNPFTDEINISLTVETGVAESYVLFDISGREISSGKFNKTFEPTISTEAIEAGSYLLKVNTLEGSTSIIVTKIGR